MNPLYSLGSFDVDDLFCDLAFNLLGSIFLEQQWSDRGCNEMYANFSENTTVSTFSAPVLEVDIEGVAYSG